jgi:predicted deacylase
VQIAEHGIARFLAHAAVLRRPLIDVPAPQSRILVVEGGDYYVYAPDGGIFEPYVALGDEVRCGQAAGAVHFPDTPWREPSIGLFARDGVVLCRRVPGRTERGDCLFHLGTDLK